MVDAAVSFTIEKLSDFVTQQINIRIGVKDGIEWLKDELGYLLISVRAAEAHQELDHIRRWTDDVKDVANQAVIILERFSSQGQEHAAPEQGGVLDCMRSFICICKKEANLFDIGEDIESLKKKVIQIKNRRDEYRINDMIIAPPNVQLRKRTLLRAASFDHEEDVVGFEDDFQTLLAQLCNGDPSLSLISIHGMGGLGKSTLASKLYRSSELSHFQHRAWVCVSEDYDIAHVLRKIIICFKRDEQKDSLNKMEEVELLRHLRKILLDRDHYLAVIDDIWDVKVWKQIKNAFPDKKNGSRVIITTRNKAVAEGADDTCFVHELRFLGEQESWQLFCERAKPTPNLERLGKDMVDKCGGLPLAIVILSGLLSQEKTYTFWSDVKDHLWRKLKGKSSEIEEILNLSFDDLSSQMRQCFLYLARYPEDKTLDVLQLKFLWIAEEFVSEAEEVDGVDMEDVAEDYLNELINRNMIQIQLLSADGQVLECRVHDLVRALAIEKAKEHKILGIFDSSKQHPNPIRLLQGQARHVIYNGICEYLNLMEPNSDDLKLRSLSLSTLTILKSEEMKMMYNRFKYLKVLDFTSVKKSKEIPEVLGDLILLKFLGLMGDIYGGSLVIPRSIGKLKKLQTLCGPGEYIFPREICELEELRHLIFRRSIGSLYLSSHQNKLQTLHSISDEEWFHMNTVNFTNLRTLFINKNRFLSKMVNLNKEFSLECMANLTSLRTLSLDLGWGNISTIIPLSSCKHLKGLMLSARLKDLAQLSFLPDSITDLILKQSGFLQDPMPTLGRMPNLIALSLDKTTTWSVQKMVCSEDAFPCLQILKLEVTDVKEIQVDERALLCLKAFDGGVTTKVPRCIASLPRSEIPTLLEFWMGRFSYG